MKRSVLVAALLSTAPAVASAQTLVHFPSANDHALLTYEDNWPARGDFDFNDAVVAYHLTYGLDAAGNVTTLRATFRPLARGADTIHSGLAMSLPYVDAERVRSVRLQNAQGALPGPHLVSGERRAVFHLAQDLEGLFFGQTGVLNALPGSVVQPSDTLELSVCFSPALPTCASGAALDERADGCIDLGAEPDVFFFRSQDFSHQVHLPQFGGTDRMNGALFNTADDASTEHRTFVDARGIPFVLSLPSGVDYPSESTPIDRLYPGIGTFGASGGAACAGFYRATGCGDGTGLPQAAHAFLPPSGQQRLGLTLYRPADQFAMACPAASAPEARNPTCTRPASLAVLTDVGAFEGTHHQSITFDPADERSPAAILAKYPSLATFDLGGGAAAIRPTGSQATDFGGEGTEGGATSGTHRVDWGYYGLSVLSLEPTAPIQAVGAMMGGSVGAAFVEVTLDDGCMQRVTVAGAGLLPVMNGASGCEAINGFLGLASLDERRIVRARFGNMRDASSLDDLYFGQAAVDHGPGPSPFPEVGFTPNGCGLVTPPAAAPAAPQAATCEAWQRDCAGSCFGAAGLDACGVCGGDDACLGGGGGQVVPPATETGSCLAAERDCTGVCFGAAQVDACGVCNGDGRACRAPAAPVAPTCAGPAPSLTVFTDIAAFSGQPHAVVTFDPADERDAASVQAKFGNLSAFRISGGAAAVRPTQSHAANFAGEGTEGGPTSGTYRVDWGYYGRSDVTATFVNPVAAAGAMFGGGAGSQGIIVTLDDGCRARIALPDYLPLVPNGANGCMAINGFLGVASTDGRKIQEIAFTSSHDASSLDDVVFGDAMTQGLGVGPTSFPESGFTATACNTGAAGGDGQAPTGPVPSAPSLPAAGACPADRPADCTGACGGTAAVDDCGVCNGDNACWGATPGSGDGVGVGGGGAAARCSGIPVQYHLLTDEAAFQGAPHSVLTFEPANQRTPAGILSAHPSLSGFSISGGAGAVRFRASHAADFGGEGTEGGPSSGDYRIDWGYYGLTSVDLAFATGVQAVGAIYGGSVGGASLLVTLDDGCEVRARILDTALASVPNGADQCSALNGFMGIALDPAETRTIVSARLSASRDASSVDDITFGAVSQVNLPPGPSPRAESPYQSQCIPAAPRCDDGIRNGGEAGVDCGGPCTACPSCSDGVRNGGEVDVDCGGPCAACLTCTDGLRGPGEDGVDCGGVCDLPCPTCSDGAQNQGEAGVDCGGPCVACPTCSDGLQNQGEAGVDCGGPCAACPSCNDGLRNQGELGVDCGGPCSAGCESCTDGIQNQGEQGVDCGTVCNNTCNCAGQTNLQPTCQALKAAVPAAQSAFYCLDPDGNAGRAPIQTYCDMATDGGGWTAITNVIASGAPRVSGGSLSTNYMLPAADIQALASWASEVRFECKRAGVATYLDVKTSNPSWTTRPWGAGDGCTQAYNWRPSLSSWSALPKNTVPIVTNPTTVSCCCRPGHSLLTYQIGMSTQNWLINDLYYNSWSRYCGGGVGEYHRIYYR